MLYLRIVLRQRAWERGVLVQEVQWLGEGGD
jgi:hypothetical protein